MLERRHIVRYLDNIIDRYTRRGVEFEEEEVRKGGLGTLDLRGEHGFLAHVRVQEQTWIREERGDGV
jgi:hypothetical protein